MRMKCDPENTLVYLFRGGKVPMQAWQE